MQLSKQAPFQGRLALADSDREGSSGGYCPALQSGTAVGAIAAETIENELER
jgi:hypothetical protein